MIIIIIIFPLVKGVTMYGKMNNVTCPHAPPSSKKDVHVLMLGTCEHVSLHEKGLCIYD